MAPPLLSLNGHPLSTAGLSWPRIGIWTADAVVSKAEPGDAGIVPWPPAEGAPATLVLGSRITLHGRIIKAGRQGEDYTVRVCGGKAGLGKRLKPKFYQGATAGDVLADLCSEVGETLSPLCTPKVLATALERWTRTEQIAGHHLYLVMAHLGVSWRTDEAGHVWVGDHAWEPLVVDASDIGVVGSRPTEDRLEFTSDEPFLRPGVVLDDFSGKGGGAFPTKGLRIARVRCAITADNTSTQAWVEPADARGAGVPPPPGAPPGDVLRGALHAIVRQTTAGVDYPALSPGKVVFQQQDGTLDIETDHDRVPHLSGIPMRLGLPGVTVKVKNGARVLVGFENGDATRPVATLWEAGGLEEITVTAGVKVTINAPTVIVGEAGMVKLAEGALPVARQGDLVVVTSMAPGTPAVGQIMTGNPRVLA